MTPWFSIEYLWCYGEWVITYGDLWLLMVNGLELNRSSRFKVSIMNEFFENPSISSPDDCET